MNGLDKDYTYILLIGASKYPNWEIMDIPNVQVNLKELGSLLSDPFYCGIPSDKITVIEDENLEDTNTAIQEFFDSIQTPKATVLLYYSGHGLQSVRAMDDLFLATRNIREKTFEASSIKISELRRLFSECIASRKILLLDCCYAGKITKGFMSDDSSDSIAKLNEFEGTYIMAASSEYERARFDSEDPNSPTKFTGKFIDVIKNGIDSDDEYCTLNSIYNQIRNSFAIQKDAPRPVQIGQDNIGSFPIFRNKKFTERVPKDEQEWNKIINSTSINAYNSFRIQFPESRYAREALKKIKVIEDDAAWRKVCNKNTIGGYWEYIDNYDNHKEDARKRLTDLSAIGQDDEIWRNAIAKNKVQFFEEYCKNYPDGKYIDEAKIIIEKVTIAESEENEWNRVDKGNISALNEYIAKYSSGKYYDDAKQQIEVLRKKDGGKRKAEVEAKLKQLEEERKRKNDEQIRLGQIAKEKQRKLAEEKFWQQVNVTNTANSFKKYLGSYPTGKYVEEAGAKIEALKKTTEGKLKAANIIKVFATRYWKIIAGIIIVGAVLMSMFIGNRRESVINPAYEPSDSAVVRPAPTEDKMSAGLLDSIQKYSDADPYYDENMEKILEAISKAPEEQQQIDFVKTFVSKCNSAKKFITKEPN